MIYSDWAATNTGIFYQLNRVKTLPFTSDTATITNLDQDFLLENASKEMFSDDTEIIVNSILAAFYKQWQDLTVFYNSLDPGTTSEVVSTSNNTAQNNSKMALSDSNDMFTTGGTDLSSNVQTSTKTKNITNYKKFVLSNNFYDTIKLELRNYLFISVY